MSIAFIVEKDLYCPCNITSAGIGRAINASSTATHFKSKKHLSHEYPIELQVLDNYKGVKQLRSSEPVEPLLVKYNTTIDELKFSLTAGILPTWNRGPNMIMNNNVLVISQQGDNALQSPTGPNGELVMPLTREAGEEDPQLRIAMTERRRRRRNENIEYQRQQRRQRELELQEELLHEEIRHAPHGRSESNNGPRYPGVDEDSMELFRALRRFQIIDAPDSAVDRAVLTEVVRDVNSVHEYISENIGNKLFRMSLISVMKTVESCDKCAICLDTIGTGRQIPECGHVFHKNCLSEVLQRRNQCPLCRGAIAIYTS